MSDFYETYLRRMNLNGKTRQERVQARREIEFDNMFFKNSDYYCQVIKINGLPAQINCSLQPATWNENSFIGNLLTSKKSSCFQTGDLLQINWKLKEQERTERWLVLFVENNLAKGHYLFKVICLEQDLNLTDEYGNTVYIAPVKFINASRSFMQDTIIKSASEFGYREPQTTRIVVSQTNDIIKKGLFFEYENRAWEVVGIDDISIKGVSYLFISERMQREKEKLSSQDIYVGEDVNFFLLGK